MRNGARRRFRPASGSNSGPVVVDSSGEVFGEAPNVAARVQGLAEAGSVLVTATVQRQTAGLFVAEDRGPQELKGVPALVTLYRIVRASGGGRRGGARAPTPLVGREEELDLLKRRWERARSGEGQLALIVGEPGIGKSRLIEEFRARLVETPHTWVEWSSSQLLQNTPLHLFAEWGRQRFGAELADEQRLSDLEGTLKLVGLDPSEHATLIAPIVDIPLPAGRALSLPPEELRRRQLAAIVALVLAGARSQAVALVVEDLHWADPTSLDLLQTLAERGRQAPLFLIATARPEFRPPWSLRSHHSVVSLSPLDRAEVERMVGDIAQRHALSKEVIEDVSERTGGVPLFVEEVTRLLLERGEDGGAHAIPPTLQQSLAARLDRLGEAREIAQIGAVLGRGFSHALLGAVAEVDDAALRSGLERLADADILFVEGAPPSASYRFKHALIQDAAYESLLKSRRQPLHRRTAEVLREGGAEPETIAHHFTEAGLDDLAIEWWAQAGDQALRRSAFQEAIAHLGKAIAMADKAAGAGATGVSAQRHLHATYGNALMAARGYGAPETTEAFAKALAESGNDKVPERLAADFGLWVGAYLRGELDLMRKLAATFLADAGVASDSPEAGVAERVMGVMHTFAGSFLTARPHFERSLALFKPGRDDDLAFRFGHDLGVGNFANAALCFWILGEVDRAVDLMNQAEARYAVLAHAATRALGNNIAAIFNLMRRDLARAAAHGAELADLARQHDLPMWRAFAAFFDWGAEPREATRMRESMRRALELLRAQNVCLYDGLLKCALAEEEAKAGNFYGASEIVNEALVTSARTGQQTFDAELHRVRGEALLNCDPANPMAAEEAIQTAIATAQQQGARSFELRAALSLARLYQSIGRPAEAHTVLAAALEGFTPTPEMPETAEALAVLTALAESDEVKTAAAQRQRRGRLQVAYGNALIAARGFGAPETTEAFTRVREGAYAEKDSPERLAADFGLWAGSYTRGELQSMRTHAAAFLADIEGRPDSPEAGVAHRAAGITHWFAGEFRPAREHLERALALFQSGRDDDLAYRFGMDPGVPAMIYLGFTLWILGEADRAVSLIENARQRVAGLIHAHTLALGTMHAAFFELMRGHVPRARTDASALARILREHDLRLFRAFGDFLEGWLIADGGALVHGLEGMRSGTENLRDQNATVLDGLIKMVLSQAEVRAGHPERALADLDDALATAERLGFRTFEAELHRSRGELMLGRDADSPELAERPFKTAIAVAHEQGARSFELRAALSLARLYRSTARHAEARAVLAPALEGFSPTPEMPEIAEAMVLSARLA